MIRYHYLPDRLGTKSSPLRIASTSPSGVVNLAYLLRKPYYVKDLVGFSNEAQAIVQGTGLTIAESVLAASRLGLLWTLTPDLDVVAPYKVRHDNFVLTDRAMQKDEKVIPLYYRSRSRFYHLDRDISTSLSGPTTITRVIQQIKIVSKTYGELIYKQDYSVELETLPERSISGRYYRITKIFILGSPGLSDTWSLEYNKTDFGISSVTSGFQETCNWEPVFSKVERSALVSDPIDHFAEQADRVYVHYGYPSGHSDFSIVATNKSDLSINEQDLKDSVIGSDLLTVPKLSVTRSGDYVTASWSPVFPTPSTYMFISYILTADFGLDLATDGNIVEIYAPPATTFQLGVMARKVSNNAVVVALGEAALPI